MGTLLSLFVHLLVWGMSAVLLIPVMLPATVVGPCSLKPSGSCCAVSVS